MSLVDELENGIDQYTLIDIIKNKLLSVSDKIFLDAKGIDLEDVLNGCLEGDDKQEIYSRLFSDWNTKLGRNIFGYDPETGAVHTKRIKYETLTLAFADKQEKAIFEEYLQGYAEWHHARNAVTQDERRTEVVDVVA